MEALLETLGVLALLSGIGNMSAGAEWYTESDTDPIDDTRSVIALRVERPGSWTRTGRFRLLFLSCEEPRPNEKPGLHAMIAWNMTAGNLLNPGDTERQDASRTTTGILTRFGDGQAQDWTYEYARFDNEMFVTIPHDMDRFLNEVRRATEVALCIEHDVTGTETAVFDLTGSARVIKAMESGCKPPSQPRTPDHTRRQRAAPTPGGPPERPPAPPSEEGALASLSTDDRAWIEASCLKHLGPALWSRCVQREVRAVRRGMPDISDLAADHQEWIEASCLRHLGPALWSRCVQREARAVRRGMPDISDLAADHQEWIEASCLRHLGPALWSRCVQREVEAIRRMQHQ